MPVRPDALARIGVDFEYLRANGRSHDGQFQRCLGRGKVGNRDIEVHLCRVEIGPAGCRGPRQVLLASHLALGIGKHGVEPGDLGGAQVVAVEARNNLVLLDPVTLGNSQSLEHGAGQTAAGRTGELHDAVLGFESAKARYDALLCGRTQRENKAEQKHPPEYWPHDRSFLFLLFAHQYGLVRPANY